MELAGFQLPTSGEVSAWVAMLAGIGGIALGLFVKTAKAQLEAKKAEAEGGLIERLLKERDEALTDAREAWKTRLADAQAISRAIEREIAMRDKFDHLQGEFDAFKRLIVRRYPEMADFFPSGHGSLPHLPTA